MTNDKGTIQNIIKEMQVTIEENFSRDTLYKILYLTFKVHVQVVMLLITTTWFYLFLGERGELIGCCPGVNLGREVVDDRPEKKVMKQ